MENYMTDFKPAHRENNSENSADKRKDRKTTVYLVRHGTTGWNRQLRYQGRADNPLDEAGERQGSLL